MFKWPTNPKNPKITVKCLNCLTLESQFFQKKKATVKIRFEIRGIFKGDKYADNAISKLYW